MGAQGRQVQPLKMYMVTFSFMFLNTGRNHQVSVSYFLEGSFALAFEKIAACGVNTGLCIYLPWVRTGQTTVNKKAPIHYIISINDKVYRPL